METLLKDIKHTLRMFRESPGFAITAVAALTLGIGVNVAIFSVVNAVLLKPIPFPEPDRLVRMMNSRNGTPAGGASSPAKFQHWRAQTDVLDVLDDVSAFRNNSMNYTSGDIPLEITVAQVSEAYFRTFGASIQEGRFIAPDEDLPGGPRVVVIGDSFWTNLLGGDPDIIGKTISLSDDLYTVVGIVGRDFDMREFGQPDAWVAFQIDPNTSDQGHYFQSAGRLKAGVSLEQAQQGLELSAAAYRDRFPDALPEGSGFSVVSFQDSIVGPAIRNALWILLGAVGFVLLIACANVANLLLVRATGRRRELAIRTAMGARRGRIIRQLLTESILLSSVGGVLGLVLGYLGMRALMSVNTAGLPRLGDEGSLLGMDWRIVLFTVTVAVGTGLVFGLVPALLGSKADLSTVIKDSGSRTGSGFRQNKVRSLLVVVEVGLAVVLLVGAALLVRTSNELGRVDPGFTVENVLTMRTSMSGSQFLASAAVEQTARAALERIRSMPGVANATATCCVPLQGGYGLPFNVVGRANEGPNTGGASWSTSTSGYFDTFEIPIRSGRAFDDRDDAGAPPVVVINETMANQFWTGGADPLADRIHIGGGMMQELAEEPERQIIGVVADVRDGRINNDPGPHMYVPQAQLPDALNALNLGIAPMAWVVRTNVDPSAISSDIQEIVRQSTGLPVTGLESMEEVVATSTSRERLNMLLMTVFGASALLLAAIGIYGLMAYSVEQRTQEIGIRLALGADSGTVKRMIVRQGIVLALGGVAVGLGAAYWLANLLAGFLYGVEPRDLLVFVSIPVILSLVALVAVWVPAHRASRINPIEALHYE
jgi:predicted permease